MLCNLIQNKFVGDTTPVFTFHSDSLKNKLLYPRTRTIIFAHLKFKLTAFSFALPGVGCTKSDEFVYLMVRSTGPQV